MIKYENATSNKAFAQMVADGKYDIIQGEKGVEIRYNLYSVPYIYGLQRINESEFLFFSKNDDFFTCNFLSSQNEITILQGEKNNKKYKTDRMLQQFMRILCIANSVLQHIEYKI